MSFSQLWDVSFSQLWVVSFSQLCDWFLVNFGTCLLECSISDLRESPENSNVLECFISGLRESSVNSNILEHSKCHHVLIFKTQCVYLLKSQD